MVRQQHIEVGAQQLRDRAHNLDLQCDHLRPGLGLDQRVSRCLLGSLVVYVLVVAASGVPVCFVTNARELG